MIKDTAMMAFFYGIHPTEGCGNALSNRLGASPTWALWPKCELCDFGQKLFTQLNKQLSVHRLGMKGWSLA